MKNLSIYVHFPFCLKKCNYCDFNTYDNIISLKSAYIEALLSEIISFKQNSNINIKTIYFGGGTPTFFNDNQLNSVYLTLKKKFNIKKNIEFTLETNPIFITQKRAFFFKNELNISKISLGIQTFSSHLLKILGRETSLDTILNAIDILKNNRFNCISYDMIFSIPTQTIDDIKQDIEYIKQFKPEHISYYSLILNKKTKLYENIKKGILKKNNNNLEAKMYKYIIENLKKIGYRQYEISSYAICKKYYSKHNLNYWNNGEYIAFGAGAHGFYNNLRYYNIKTIKKYIKNIKKKESVIQYKEKMNFYTNLSNYIILRLRTKFGIDFKKIDKIFKINFLDKYKNEIDFLLKNKLISIDNKKMKLTKKGIFLANFVFEKFI